MDYDYKVTSRKQRVHHIRSDALGLKYVYFTKLNLSPNDADRDSFRKIIDRLVFNGIANNSFASKRLSFDDFWFLQFTMENSALGQTYLSNRVVTDSSSKSPRCSCCVSSLSRSMSTKPYGLANFERRT